MNTDPTKSSHNSRRVALVAAGLLLAGCTSEIPAKPAQSQAHPEASVSASAQADVLNLPPDDTEQLRVGKLMGHFLNQLRQTRQEQIEDLPRQKVESITIKELGVKKAKTHTFTPKKIPDTDAYDLTPPITNNLYALSAYYPTDKGRLDFDNSFGTDENGEMVGDLYLTMHSNHFENWLLNNIDDLEIGDEILIKTKDATYTVVVSKKLHEEKIGPEHLLPKLEQSFGDAGVIVVCLLQEVKGKNGKVFKDAKGNPITEQSGKVVEVGLKFVKVELNKNIKGPSVYELAQRYYNRQNQ